MNSIVGVRFRKPGKVYFFDPDNLDIEKGQKVIVETNQGQEIGEVTTAKKEIHEESLKAPLKKVIRIATPKDIKIDESNRKKEKEIGFNYPDFYCTCFRCNCWYSFKLSCAR